MDALMIGSMVGLLTARTPARAKALLHFHTVAGRCAAITLVYAIWLLQMKHMLGWFTVPFGNTSSRLRAHTLLASYAPVPRGLGFRVLNVRP
jgi:hypothetical protein